MLGQFYAYKGEYDKALAEVERGIALDPNGSEVHARYGLVLMSAGRAEEAIPIFQKMIRLDPFCPYYGCFGTALRDTGRFEEAVSAYKKALQLAPDSIFDHIGLAVTYNYIGRPEEAIPLFQKAIRLSPFGPSYLYGGFGTALQDTGQFEEAVSAYKKAIQVAPGDISAHIGLAVTYIMMGREKEARAEATEILGINPKFSVDSWAKNSLYKKSQTDKLVDTLRKAGLK
jgi:tetratricopeptide (TPR) repeat protein